MFSNDAFAAIAALDLAPIKTKLMHKQSGEGWSLAQADAVEQEYRRFLYLMKTFPHESTAPMTDVDTFWHYHILDTMKYAADCEQVFGYFLHHYPYVGMDGEEEDGAQEVAGQRMRALYEQTFGAGDALAAAAYCGVPPSTKAAYCGIPPSAKAAYCGIPPSTKAAYCGIPPSTKAAYCGIPPSVKAAYCGIPPSVKAAYCGIPPSVKAAYCGVPPSVTTGYCGVPPTVKASADQDEMAQAS